MLTREENEMLTRVGRGTPNHFKFLIAWRTLRPFEVAQDMLCGSRLLRAFAIQQAIRISNFFASLYGRSFPWQLT
jgi:hypothetical protein